MLLIAVSFLTDWGWDHEEQGGYCLKWRFQIYKVHLKNLIPVLFFPNLPFDFVSLCISVKLLALLLPLDWSLEACFYQLHPHVFQYSSKFNILW